MLHCRTTVLHTCVGACLLLQRVCSIAHHGFNNYVSGDDHIRVSCRNPTGMSRVLVIAIYLSQRFAVVSFSV